MIDLYFYTTVGCHLCEQAEQLFENMMDNNSVFNLVTIDIAEQQDDVLIERYGIRIPVIVRMDNQLELAWPFSEQELQQFLAR